MAGTELTPFGTTTNFQPYLARIQRSGARAVYCFHAGAEAVAFVKQYQQFGLAGRIPLYCSGFVTEGGVLEAQGDAALGIKGSLHYSDQLDNPTNQRFVADYSARYGDSPTVYAVQAYDAAAVLDQALAKGTTGDAIVEGLKGIGEIDRPRGRWRFTDGHGPDQVYYLRATEEQGGKIVKRHRAAAHRFLTRAGLAGRQPDHHRRRVALGVLLFTIAVGLSLVFGVMDVLNLAHGALYLVGAYLAVRFVGDGRATVGAFLVAGLAAVAVGAAAGAGLAVMTRPLARRGHLDQALLTLGVALVVGDLLSARFGNDVQSVPPPAFLSGSVSIAGHDYPSYRLAVIVAGLALAVAVYLLVERSRAGALVRATVADAAMVRAMDVDTGRLVVAVFAVGVVLACLGGVPGGAGPWRLPGP